MKIETKENAQVKRPGAGKEFMVTKDHDIDVIKKAHREGYSIKFKGDEDFIDLSPEDLAELPKALMVYYTVALKENLGQLDSLTDTMSKAGTAGAEFGYDLRVADPEDQLKIEGLPEGMRGKWVRAYDDQLAKYRKKGYMVTPGKAARSFSNPDGSKGHHYVGSEDKPEMVHMMISDENFKLNEQRIKKASDLRKAAAKKAFVDQVEKTGMGAFGEVEGD